MKIYPQLPPLHIPQINLNFGHLVCQISQVNLEYTVFSLARLFPPDPLLWHPTPDLLGCGAIPQPRYLKDVSHPIYVTLATCFAAPSSAHGAQLASLPVSLPANDLDFPSAAYTIQILVPTV